MGTKCGLGAIEENQIKRRVPLDNKSVDRIVPQFARAKVRNCSPEVPQQRVRKCLTIRESIVVLSGRAGKGSRIITHGPELPRDRDGSRRFSGKGVRVGEPTSPAP
jgi:hypothetical protein